MEIKFNGLKERALRKKLRKLATNKKVEIRSLESYKNILVSSEAQMKDATKIVKEIFPNAQVHQLFHRKDKEDKSALLEYSVHDADFNLSGGLKNVKLTKLLKESFDLVIDLSRNSVALNYLVGSAKADIIIGNHSAVNSSVYDLVLPASGSTDDFFQVVKSQISLLSSNG